MLAKRPRLPPLGRGAYTAIHIGGTFAAVVLILILLAAAGVFSTGASKAGHDKVVTTTTPASPPTEGGRQYPFGAPCGKADYTDSHP
jgi:hypothetical protein